MPGSTRTIGKLAEEVGVSVETIRFYERRGLIEQPARMDGRYRVYSDQLLAQVRYIRIAQALGFSLSDVEKLRGEMTTKGSFCAAVERTVKQKLSDIDEELIALSHLKQDLLSFQSRCSRRSSKDCPLYDELSQLGLAVSGLEQQS